MSNQHCPLCNTSDIHAMGAVAYSQSVVVEHRCGCCGHVFYLSDRRSITAQFLRTLEEFREDEPLLARRYQLQ